MEYKISQLVEETGVPKSTILYYIKEGLLPEARKIRSNVHRYSDEHLELIKYIKYMQHEMQASIGQIKHILSDRDSSFSSSAVMLAPLMGTLSGLEPDETSYTKAELLALTKIDEALLDELLDEQILVPIKPDEFTDKELAVLRVVERFLSVDVAFPILKQYARHASELAELEEAMMQSLCEKRSNENFSTLWQITFEMLFTVKPYVFNRHTHEIFKERLKEELSLDPTETG